MDLMTVDLSEALTGREGGYWFSFEDALKRKDEADPNPMTEGDLAELRGEQRAICKFYPAGRCQRGARCVWRHQRTEKATVCKHWLRSLCKKMDNCEFLHQFDLSKMPECYFFSKYGECTNPECLYRHLAQDDKSAECPWYARGFCKHGERCRFRHIQKVMCENYYLGFCPEGPNCKFGHPKWDVSLPQGDDSGPPGPQRANANLICHICGQPGHKAQFCPTAPKQQHGERKPIEEVTCYKCGQRGHYANHCTLPFGVGGPQAKEILNAVQGNLPQQFPQNPPFPQQQYYGRGGMGGRMNMGMPSQFQPSESDWRPPAQTF